MAHCAVLCCARCNSPHHSTPRCSRSPVRMIPSAVLRSPWGKQPRLSPERLDRQTPAHSSQQTPSTNRSFPASKGQLVG